uniref:Uncharacterized protein n=1 Tax=Arundo donax TaxID=35708 RepID=A0A0A9BPH0_ARUDO
MAMDGSMDRMTWLYPHRLRIWRQERSELCSSHANGYGDEGIARGCE